MPKDFECPGCGFEFSLGRYHYADGVRTLLLCRDCGTPHVVDRASRRDQRLLARDAPILPGTDTSGSAIYGPTSLEAGEIQSNPALRKVAEGSDAMDALFTEKGRWDDCGPTGRKAVASASCRGCGRKGTLVDRWPRKGAPCPLCGQEVSGPQSWKM